jgi:hypothetical protein
MSGIRGIDVIDHRTAQFARSRRGLIAIPPPPTPSPRRWLLRRSFVDAVWTTEVSSG